MIMTNESGQSVWQGEFKPFGEPYSITGSVTNNLRFPGQYYDSETGLHQNWWRDYRSQTGTYLTFDPVLSLNGDRGIPYLINTSLRDPRKLNPYSYVGNNPVNFIDPLGLAKGDWWDPRTYLPEPPPPGPPGSGCGDEKWDPYVPDFYPEACRIHDKCYGQKGSCRRSCDKELWWNAFVESGPWPNIFTPTIYWIGIRTGGKDAFNRAQKGESH